ncbi:MAG: hypothetical protein J2P48_07850 [Alphaproteobacteria bacterium]|nr:hypothetical protein [Alphaproteobacteria bacterium]
MARSHVAWDRIDPINPYQGEARWLLLLRCSSRRWINRRARRCRMTRCGINYEASFSRMHVAHASIGPSCGLAVYRDDKLQGVGALSGRLSATRCIGPHAINASQ